MSWQIDKVIDARLEKEQGYIRYPLAAAIRWPFVIPIRMKRV